MSVYKRSDAEYDPLFMHETFLFFYVFKLHSTHRAKKTFSLSTFFISACCLFKTHKMGMLRKL